MPIHSLRAGRTLAIGAALGLLILGVGGRIAMAYVTIESGGNPAFTLGGTMTVVLLGAVSGLAGAVIALACRWLVRRMPDNVQWLQYILLAALLGLVTARGLRGTEQPGAEWFWGLVAVYGVALAWLTVPRRESARGPTPVSPAPPD